MSEYNGNIEIISGLTPANNGDFPVAQAKDICIGENEKRLDNKLNEIDEALDNIESYDIATEDQALSGTDDTTIMTPAKVALLYESLRGVPETTANLLIELFSKIAYTEDTHTLIGSLETNLKSNGLGGHTILSNNAQKLLMQILQNCTFGNDQSSNLTQLKKELGFPTDDKSNILIIKDLSNVSLSNPATSVMLGDSYYSEIVLDDSVLKSVKITMGNTDITSSVWYIENHIEIPKVTDTVTITVVASKRKEELDFPTNDLLFYFDLRNANIIENNISPSITNESNKNIKITTSEYAISTKYGIRDNNSDLIFNTYYPTFNGYNKDNYRFPKEFSLGINFYEAIPYDTNMIYGFVKTRTYSSSKCIDAYFKDDRNYSYLVSSNAIENSISIKTLVLTVNNNMICMYINGGKFKFVIDSIKFNDFTGWDYNHIDAAQLFIKANHYVSSIICYNRALSDTEVLGLEPYFNSLNYD